MLVSSDYWSRGTGISLLPLRFSFEHDYVAVDDKGNEKVAAPSDELLSLKHANTIWNAKVAPLEYDLER